MRVAHVDVLMPSDLHEPRWGDIGEEVYRRTYSRTKKDGTKETWAETVKRVVDGNCNFVDPKYIEPGEPERLFNLIYNFKLLPGGRHIWATGVKGRQFCTNCWAAGHDPNNFSRHFTFTFARLMEGGGVGSNYSNPYLAHYPAIKKPIELHIVCDKTHKDYGSMIGRLSDKYSPDWTDVIQIEDCREGWTASLDVLIKAHFGDVPELTNGHVVFDVSKIRPSGAKLKSFGGTASGPAALVEMLHLINDCLNDYVGKKPDSMLCLKIDHEIARCVVSGNVRRSARMAMKHWRDSDIKEFIRMKRDGKSHWTTNISVIVDKFFWQDIRRGDPKAMEILDMIAEGALLNGEPGIFNITKAKEGEIAEIFATNPCGEQVLVMWGSCNLGHVNLRAFARDETGLYDAFRMMTRFLLRATYADFPDAEAKAIVDRDRRIGLGIAGFADWLILEGCRFSQFPSNNKLKERLHIAYRVVRNMARDYAFQLRIPEPVKVTTAAPTGSTAQMPGISEGMQPTLFKYFIRRVLMSTVDPDQIKLIEEAQKQGLKTEPCEYTPNTMVVEYVCKASILDEPGVDESMVEEASELSLEECLDVQKTMQDVFVDSAISFTINVEPKAVTKEDIIRALRSFGPHIKGTTIMPKVSNRKQMPYERITKEQYEKASKKFKMNGEYECNGDSCRRIGVVVVDGQHDKEEVPELVHS